MDSISITVVLAAYGGEKRTSFVVSPSSMSLRDFIQQYLPYPDLLVVPRSLLHATDLKTLAATHVLPTTPCVKRLLDTPLNNLPLSHGHVLMQDLLLVAINDKTQTRLVLRA
jgi:hypothetical protein